MPAGRPSTYSPAYCEEVISYMAQGYSLTAFAGEIGVARSTINVWMEAHPEFSEAVKKAKAKCAQEWERRALDVMIGAKFKGAGAATLAMFGLKNMAADDWADRASVNHTSSDGSMTPKAAIDVSGLSTEALAEIVAAANAAGSGDD